ncbi:MAG: DUF4091 domain-containing protein [Vicinamibacteria bacterium]|nr:DUF4091 domain-containing protein [Vicinamibacteria bacterium]
MTIALVTAAFAADARAGIRRVWAVNDGEKIERDSRDHPARAGNSAWDGRVVRLTGARNEVLAVQVIVEADARGVGALSLRLPELASATDRITYRPPAADPTDTVGRSIQIFAVNYMQVTTPSHASWVFDRASPAAPADPTGWKPVQLVPENAAGRGGLPVAVRADENQAIWIEVYVQRQRAPGLYRGTLEVAADGATYSLPVELEVLDFTLPDENSMHAMLYYSRDQPERYHGRNLDPAYHRLAHRHRVELVNAYDEKTLPAVWGRFSGADFTAANGYDGPGAGVGNVLAPRSFYGPGREFDDRATAWARSDAWMTFLRDKLPRAITFLYMPDEPGASEYPRILALADNIHSNPGPGRTLPILVTSAYAEGIDAAIDIWDSGPKGFRLDRVTSERARGRQYWFYNGGRPAGGAITIDAPATDARATIWAAFKHDVRVYFYWHAVHWRHNAQKVGDRDQNVWADSITFDNRKQPNKPIDDQGYIHGDGVLLYPGEERLHPDQDRGVPGPIATVQLANLRRGLQDHQYLTLARRLGLDGLVAETLSAIVPRVFSDATDRVSFPETGDPYEAARLRLGRAIAAAQAKTSQGPPVSAPVLFDTPEADRILSRMQIFPSDNPWNEDIWDRPVHPDSAAIVARIGADKPLGYNLDMNFVLVPDDQPRVPVRVTMYPAESDSGPFPIPSNAPIENWPLSRNEDRGALPSPGVTLEQFQREGTGDRHLIVVDPGNNRLHEFWQARLTDTGWEASQASTFDLSSNRLRPERWTSSDAAGLPVFPAIVRYDEVARGLVRHAMRVTVRRTRRDYVYPATHFASALTDSNLPRMGERLRLRKDFDTSSFPPHARAVLEGLKRYGMIVADNGSDWLMSIAPDRRLEGLESLARVKGSDFEVIVPTGPADGPRARPK